MPACYPDGDVKRGIAVADGTVMYNETIRIENFGSIAIEIVILLVP